MFWIYLVSAAALDTLGFASAKKFLLTADKTFLFWGVFCYLLMIFFLFQLLRFRGIAVANILWIGLVAISITAVGVLYYQEKISPVQWIGITLILMGAILIEWPTK